MNIICTVDILTRHIALPVGVQIASYDHNVDVIQFNIEPIEDFSLDTSSIKIAAQGPNKARHDYAVDPSTVQIEEETGYVTFDWPIPQGVTEMPEDMFGYGSTGQLIFAVCAEIISGSTVSKAWHSDDGIITVVAHLEPEVGGGEDPEEEATNAQKIGQLQTATAILQREISGIASGTPPAADSTAEMDPDESTVYINTTDGNWYYWDGSAWQIGGVYGGATTSTTFNQHGVPADDFAVGEALAEKADSDDVDTLDDRVTALENEGSSSVPTNVRQAIYSLMLHNAFKDNDVADAMAVIGAWASVVTGISVSPATANISGSATQQLTAVTTPSGGAVTWSSSDDNVATVSSTGLVTGIGNGSATITASSGDKTASCVVTVSGFTMRSITNNLTHVANSNSATSIADGEAYTATLSLSSEYYDWGTVTITMGGTDITGTAYSNGQISIASVTDDVVITATGTGGLYALDQFTHEFTASNLTGKATVSDGNLVRLETTESSTTENWWTALKPSSNNGTAKNNTGNSAGATTDTLFSISSGDTVKFVFEDVEGTTTSSRNWTHQFTCMLKTVGSSPVTAVTSGTQNGTGTVEATVSASSNANIGAIVAFVGSAPVGYIQYRLKIFVNGVRYI